MIYYWGVSFGHSARPGVSWLSGADRSTWRFVGCTGWKQSKCFTARRAFCSLEESHDYASILPSCQHMCFLPTLVLSKFSTSYEKPCGVRVARNSWLRTVPRGSWTPGYGTVYKVRWTMYDVYGGKQEDTAGSTALCRYRWIHLQTFPTDIRHYPHVYMFALIKNKRALVWV